MRYAKVTGLTRYTYEKTSFQGYRLAVSIKGHEFVRYFSEKKLGNRWRAYTAAREAIESIRSICKESRSVRLGKLTKKTIRTCNTIIDDAAQIAGKKRLNNIAKNK